MRGRWSGRRTTKVGTLVATAVVVGAGAAVGCSSSTSPSTSNAFALAEHFDSLAMQAAASGQFDRSQLLTYPTAVLSEGTKPATVSVTVGGTAGSYQGLAANLVYTTAGTPIDSTYVLIVWRGTNVDELVYVLVDATGSVNNLGYYPDTTTVGFGNATAAATGNTPAGACHFIDLTYGADLVQGATCTPQTIQASFNVQIQVAPATSPATYAMSTTPLPGVRLQIPASPSATDLFQPWRALHRTHTAAGSISAGIVR